MSLFQKSVREQFNISRIAIQHPWLTLGFWIAVSVAGLLAFSSLKYALLPDITFPVVVVNAEAPLTTALDTEAKLTEPLERGLQSLKTEDGLGDIRSSTYPGRSLLTLTFDVGTDLEESTDRVKQVLNQEKLPQGSSYKVIPINLNESSAISYALFSSKRNLAELTETAQAQILPAIAKIPGVLKVELLGAPTEAKVKDLAQKNAAEEVVLAPGSSAVRMNGQNALAIEVVKRSNANTLEVVENVESAVKKLQPQLSDVTLSLAATQAGYIREATHATIDALVLAIALSVIVIFPFLWNWKATLISALAIPTSLLGTFIVMAIFGYNLETITLLALALVIGIIVDDAIVDVENISRHMEEGSPPKQAAIEATNEIGSTVTAATFTIVAVFLPIGLMTGVIGQFFRPFGITVSAAVIISLLVARTLSPLLAVKWLRPRDEYREDRNWTHFIRWYSHLLQWSLNHRWIVVGLATLSFIAGVALIPYIPKGFIPQLDQGEFNINYTTPLPAAALNQMAATTANPAANSGENSEANPAANAPTNPAETATADPAADPAALAAQAQQAPVFNPVNDALEAGKKLEAAALKSPEVETVFTTVGTRNGQPNTGTIYVKLRENRTIHTAALQDQFRRQLPVLPGVTVNVEDIPFVDTGSEKPVQVALIGENPQLLSQTAKKIQQRLKQLPGFVDVSVTGTTTENSQVQTIDRLNSQRVAYVSADLEKGIALGSATDQVVAIVNEVKPAGISLDLGSDSARVGEIFESFGATLALSVLCILLVLVFLFRSWTDPLVIIFSLPLSILGAFLVTLFTGSEFGVISVIGIIFLLGLTNKNAILLVDYINQLRRSGVNREDSILKAGPVRLRPILMTTFATILGMLPIALGIGAGAELRAPMAIAIIGGLVTSTLLSLLVVPVVYALLDDLKFWRKPRKSLIGFPEGQKGKG
ncbi:efflux RND transporter permease subunit [Kovacikia minuta CCNUW1]|uniref:efflux RND transporter permease subunit n=1 Tax=Kovacikia minuta TaxID=2931930 RepID=UPI001CCB8971|nr:efflux RND transporter permease subunit [Kovacikia minuta]UBF24911.1 efflux RND transporter permease subunit [Kovacikia minuta CCNUW1]